MMRRVVKNLARYVNVLEKVEAAVASSACQGSGRLVEELHRFCSQPKPNHHTKSGDLSDQGSSTNDQNVSSLSQFFDEIRRLRKSIGASTNRDRNLMREELCQFWEANILGAVSNAKNARDVGFICSFAQTDVRLTIPALCLSSMFQLLVRDKRVVTATDATVSYHILAREACRVLTDDQATTEARECVSSDFVVVLVANGLTMLQKLFRSERNHVGRGDDALNGLEFIISLTPVDPESTKLAITLFHVVCEDDLRMTSLSQAFGLLRAFSKRLPTHSSAEIALALLRQVRRRDERLVNGFHFLKIVNCVSRIPSPFLQNEKMWVYLVSKACMFVPNMQWKHKEVTVISLRIALHRRNMGALLKPLEDEIKAILSPQEFEALVLKPLDAKIVLRGEPASEENTVG